MKIRKAYGYDPDEASLESGIEFRDESMTVQDHKEECDINTIAMRFGLFGQLPTDVRAPTYGDFTEVQDYHSAMNALAQANEAFEAMPAKVRARFHNNPAEFVDFCSDESNRDEAVKLGLVHEKARALSTDAVREGISPETPPQSGEGTVST